MADITKKRRRRRRRRRRRKEKKQGQYNQGIPGSSWAISDQFPSTHDSRKLQNGMLANIFCKT
jgi:hypothetical protein